MVCGWQKPFRVLALACGPALELQQLLQTTEDARKFEIVLVDQDADALRAAKQTVDKVWYFTSCIPEVHIGLVNRQSVDNLVWIPHHVAVNHSLAFVC